MSIALTDTLHFGLQARLDSRDDIRATVRRAEDAGLESLWVGEHIVFTGPIHDPLLRLAQAAAYSERLSFGTAVYLLPLRPPAAVAKQVITLDHLTGGRLVFGAGVGGEFPKEFEVCGVPHGERGARLGEGIEVLRALWSGESVSHAGRFWSFTDVRLDPPPLQPGGPPIWLGGRQPAALRRIGRKADGWMSYVVTPEQYAAGLEVIGEAADRAGRRLDRFATAHLLFVRIDDSRERALADATAMLSHRYGMDFSRPAARYPALGPPAAIAERILAFRSAGVRRFILDFIATPEEEAAQIARFAEAVRPLLG